MIHQRSKKKNLAVQKYQINRLTSIFKTRASFALMLQPGATRSFVVQSTICRIWVKIIRKFLCLFHRPAIGNNTVCISIKDSMILALMQARSIVGSAITVLHNNVKIRSEFQGRIIFGYLRKLNTSPRLTIMSRMTDDHLKPSCWDLGQ